MPCTTILVGKLASNDGSTIIARNDDGGFEPKRIIVGRPNFENNKYLCKISKLEIELPEGGYRYTSAPTVDGKWGLWPACGINEKNVAMTATETITANPRVLGADPMVELIPKDEKDPESKDIPGGFGEEDLVTIVLPYINSAREGVIRVGELLEKYGTYESNGMAFSDENEIWWLESIGGHHWIARRVEDNEVVIMPNQFGLDHFDLKDAYSEQKKNMCSKDLKEFIKKFNLDLNIDEFNPRYVFGTQSDQDHIYNTPRSWYMTKYFCPNTYNWGNSNPTFTPISDNLPWSLVPEKKVTIEDVKYVLSSYYQNTPYNPYDSTSPEKGKYRVIGVPNTDVCGILQIRNGVKEELKGVEWVSLGGGAFTACFPLYTYVDNFPAYINVGSTKATTTDHYWTSRLISALVDSHHASAVIFTERYQKAIFVKGHEILNKYDNMDIENPCETLEQANQEMVDYLEKESTKVLTNVLGNASNKMKTRFNRNDN